MFYLLYMYLLDMIEQEWFVFQLIDLLVEGLMNVFFKWLFDMVGGKDGVVQLGGVKKVYCKDMFGYVGQYQGVWYLYFEVFMLDVDFIVWFDQDGYYV